MNRREFVVAGAAAGLAAATPPRMLGQAPAVRTGRVRPVVIGSSNGNRYKNGGTQTCVEKAFSMMTGGADVLDALIAGVNIVELDPTQTGVGWSGLPNADGVVQLDASCMHGPKKRAGAVAALEGVRTPSLVAKAVMEETDHHLLVGRDAQRFARTMGFTIEHGLIGDRARELWLEWKRRTDPGHYLDPKKRAELGEHVGLDMVREGLIDPDQYWGTINCDGVNDKGEICGVTTTSGLAWKIPGRAGDSPILGAGLYVSQDSGAAGSTGRGEANLYALSSFFIVEAMGRGLHPKDAGLEALRRVKAKPPSRRCYGRAAIASAIEQAQAARALYVLSEPVRAGIQALGEGPEIAAREPPPRERRSLIARAPRRQVRSSRFAEPSHDSVGSIRLARTSFL
jgi:N4-(beta-N-acetylglucosaminyl)-L-asparaginase